MIYTVFAGANGSGKSSLYETQLIVNTGERINVDDIANDTKEQYRVFPINAGKTAVEKMNLCIARRIPFNQETTLSGHSALRTIKRVAEIG